MRNKIYTLVGLVLATLMMTSCLKDDDNDDNGDYDDNDDDDDYDDDYTSIVRANAVSFVIDGKGYLVTGEYGSLLSNYWIYDPATDLWEGEDLTAFEGSVRKNAVAFSTGTRGFVVTGQASSSYYDDTWELSPYEYEEE